MSTPYALFDDDCAVCCYLKKTFALIKLAVLELKPNTPLPAIPVHACFICPSIQPEGIAAIKALYAANPDASLIVLQADTEKRQIIDVPHSVLMPNFFLQDLLNLLAKASAAQLPDKSSDDGTTELAPHFQHLVGISTPMQTIRQLIRQVAECDTTVLISGESGTGKEVIASCIHQLSNRRQHPLVPINCGAIPNELMESELFGHEKGAFTGAHSKRQGRFEIANQGTLFLDEIGEMPLPMQVKLLRVIQERKIERIGGNNSINIDVRLIAATNKNLEKCVHDNTFREDLFYRLNVFPIHVPSLRDRASDIPYLIEYHLDKIHARLGHRVVFSEDALAKLCDYNWPGNIRELVNFLERMVIMHRDQVLTVDQLPGTLGLHAPLGHHPVIEWDLDEKFDMKDYMARMEQSIIKAALTQANGMISRAAEYLSLRRTTLIEKMKKYNISADKSVIQLRKQA